MSLSNPSELLRLLYLLFYPFSILFTSFFYSLPHIFPLFLNQLHHFLNSHFRVRFLQLSTLLFCKHNKAVKLNLGLQAFLFLGTFPCFFFLTIHFEYLIIGQLLFFPLLKLIYLCLLSWSKGLAFDYFWVLFYSKGFFLFWGQLVPTENMSIYQISLTA